MNVKKIIGQMIILVILINNLGIDIDIHASVPSKLRIYETKSFDGSIKLTWYINHDATSYVVKRSESRLGKYTVIADNLLVNTFEDTGLINAKTYYYKIAAKNSEGLGIDSDIIEGIPSKTNYIWFETYGLRSVLRGIDIYDEDNNLINYSSHFIGDETDYISSSCDYARNLARDLINHNNVIFNINDRWDKDRAPKSRAGFKLNSHKGIKKIVIHAGAYSPMKTCIYESIDSGGYNLVGEKLVLNYEIIGKTKEYEIFRSGLKAEGQDKQVYLKWNSVEDANTYTIKRSESKEGPFIIIAKNINTLKYTDDNLENKKVYYYKVEAINKFNKSIDLGTVYAKTTKDRYIIFDLFESYNKDIYINELQMYDKKNNKINYSYVVDADFKTPTTYIPNIKGRLGASSSWFDKAQDNNLENSVYLLNYNFDGQWIRFVLRLDENTGIENINLWTNSEYEPKKVTFFKSLSYDYKNNLVLRRNDNLSFFAEKNIADNDVVTKYEFTQTAPNTPQGVNANSQDTKATIKWNKVDNADSYTIKRSTSSGGPYTVIQENIVDLQYTDMGLANGTEYYYVVSAVNKGGESNNSLEASVIPSAKLPQAPIGLTIEAQQNVLNLSWNPVYNATSYAIKRSETAGGPYETILEDTTATSYNDSGLTFGTTYYYVVTAKNTIGTSNNSEEVQGTPGQVLPGKPTNLITKVKENKVYLTWDTASHAVSYNVLRSESEEGIYNILDNVKGLSYKDATVEADKTYFYKIIAKNEEGESEESEKIRVIVKDNIEQKILLSLIMKNGSTKEYIITHSQLMKFMNWYQCNTMKQGLPYFTLMANNKYGAYKSSKKYILFDSIMAMDVKEVQAN